MESLRKKLEKEKKERFILFNRVRKNLPDIVKVTAEFNPEKVVLFGSITNKKIKIGGGACKRAKLWMF